MYTYADYRGGSQRTLYYRFFGNQIICIGDSYPVKVKNATANDNTDSIANHSENSVSDGYDNLNSDGYGDSDSYGEPVINAIDNSDNNAISNGDGSACCSGNGGCSADLAYETKPGAVEATDGFSLTDNPSFAEHMDGECSDAVTPAPPVKISFPNLKLPAIQFAAVQSALSGYTVLPDEYPTLGVTVEADDQQKNELERYVFTGDCSNTAVVANLNEQLNRQITLFSDQMKKKGVFTESFSIFYALKMRRGNHTLVSAPVTIKCNDHSWHLPFKTFSPQSGSVYVETLLVRRPCRLAISLPDCERNRKWKEFISDPKMLKEIERIDFFASPATPEYPDPERSINTTVFKETDSCNVGLKSDGTLSFGQPIKPTPHRGLLYRADTDAITDRILNPESFRLCASLKPEKLSTDADWQLLELNTQTLYATDVEIAKPDYESAHPGEGSIMLEAAGVKIVANPEFGYQECSGGVDCMNVRSQADLYPAATTPDTSNPAATTPDASNQDTTGNMGTGKRIILGIHREGTTSYYLQADSDAWPEGDFSPGAIFHPRNDITEIIEEDKDLDRHRIFSLIQNRNGHSLWHSETMDIPEWQEGLSEEGKVALPLSTLKYKKPSLLLCSESEGYEWYPEASRSVFADNKEDITSICRFTGPGSGKNTLLAFTTAGIWTLTPENYQRNGISYTTWRVGDIISIFTTFSYRSTLTLNNGVIFITPGGVMRQQGTSTVRLSSRGTKFSANSILRYHPEVDILEVEDQAHIWWYDVEEGKEIETGSNDPYSSLDAAAYTYITSYATSHLSDTSSDNTSSDNTSSDNTSSGDTSSGDTSSGDTSSGESGDGYMKRENIYGLVTLPFILRSTKGEEIRPNLIRIAGSKSIGNYCTTKKGRMIVEYSHDLHTWHLSKAAGMELSHPLPEGAGGKRIPAPLFWRVAISVEKGWGMPLGMEIRG